MNKTNDIDIIADFIIRNPDLAKIEYPELLTCLENRMIEKSPIFTAAIIDKFSKNLNSAIIDIENTVLETERSEKIKKLREVIKLILSTDFDNDIIYKTIDKMKPKLIEANKKTMNFLMEKEFLEKPIFEVIDCYFGTFDILHSALYDFVINYNKRDEIYSESLESEALFLMGVNTVKSRIAIEINNGGNLAIIKRYIEDKYTTVKNNLQEWESKYSDCNTLKLSMRKSYIQSSYYATIFYCNVDFWGTNSNPKDPTIGDFYNKVLQELENEYKVILSIFPNTLSESSQVTLEPQHKDNEFTVLLMCDANKIEKIMRVITPIMKAGGQTDIAIVLMALCKLKYIILPERDKEKRIYTPIISAFDVKLTCKVKTFANGISNALGSPDKYFYNETYKGEIERLIELLK